MKLSWCQALSAPSRLLDVVLPDWVSGEAAVKQAPGECLPAAARPLLEQTLSPQRALLWHLHFWPVL